MKVYSTHFILKGKSDYKDLAPVFPDILKMFLEEIGQTPEEEEILQMLIELNMMDLLVFPMDRKEFYLKTYTKSTDLSHIADNISNMLTAAGISFTVKQNDNVEFD